MAVAILAIGLVHLVTGNLPSGFLPVTLAFPGKAVLIYLSGIALVSSGMLILVNRYIKPGVILGAFYFLAMVLFVHIPALVQNVRNAAEWTGTFEPFSFFSGLLILLGIELQNEGVAARARSCVLTGNYLFAMGLFVFGLAHVMYEKFVITWMPAWIPFPVFWARLVPICFFSAFISGLIRKYVRLSSLLLALMFFLWVLIVNLPRALTIKTEPELTGTFIALGMSGIALLIAGSADFDRLQHDQKQRK